MKRTENIKHIIRAATSKSLSYNDTSPKVDYILCLGMFILQALNSDYSQLRSLDS